MKITYLDHSGFAVDLGDKLLIFDYYRGELPAGTSDRKLYVFSSHAHQDHFQKKIFAWSGDRDVTYILSKDIRKNAAAKSAPGEGVYYLAPRQELTLDGLSVRTLRSTDAGVAFLVEAEGKTIYHAGDLNWWHWEGEDPAWNRNMEVDFKRFSEPLRGRRIDLAMLPLDPRLGADGFRGPRSFLELADIRRFLPMHQWGDFAFTEQFLAACPQFRDRTVPVVRQGQQFTWE